MKDSMQMLLLFVACLLMACSGPSNSQNATATILANSKVVGGGCDGCEIMYVGMPQTINATDTSAGWQEKGQKLLVTGKVYKQDGTTPAEGVIIYYWQTDNDGYYSPRPNMDERAKRHGHIRGWVKTDAEGKYAIYTVRPSPYPNENIPAHIHTSIKEPNIKQEYYIDEFVFDDDPLLTTKERKKAENRGGSGVLRVLLSGELQIAEHNIILGLHIPNYPISKTTNTQSGLEIGEDSPSFTPYHAYGPDKGTRTCPVCKYGRYQGILYFVGNHPDWDEIKKWLVFLEQQSTLRDQYLKAYFVYGNEIGYNKEVIQKELETLGNNLQLKKVALTYVPSMKDAESEVNLNKINPSVENTFVIYRHRTIIGKFIDLKPEPENFELIETMLNKTKSNYLDLKEPPHH